MKLLSCLVSKVVDCSHTKEKCTRARSREARERERARERKAK